MTNTRLPERYNSYFWERKTGVSFPASPYSLLMNSTLLLLSLLAQEPLVCTGTDSLAAREHSVVMNAATEGHCRHLPGHAPAMGSVIETEPRTATEDSLPGGDLQLILGHRNHNPYPPKKKPSFMLVGKKKWIQYNPVNLTFGGMLFLYQSVISSQISADCPYEVSCSNFSKQSIQHFGLLKGCALSADRLTRCTKLAAKKIHPLRISKEGMLIDSPDFYSVRKHKAL
ncbi:MAG: membrane protein insertion efficiency factor YidD [Bacteroidia bacterium]|nr:membrane protein insertion efficiency factor YidD [Bacteroidia bacterium]